MMISSTAGKKRDIFSCRFSVVSLGVVAEEVILNGVVDLVLVIPSVMASACVVRRVDSVVGG